MDQYLTANEESIYNLVAPLQRESVIQEKYVSKYKNLLSIPNDKVYKWRSMGHVEKKPVKKQYLKKGEGIKRPIKKIDRKFFKKEIQEFKKSQVEDSINKVTAQGNCKMNFKRQNNKVRDIRLVDHRNGHNQKVEDSGLIPKYVYKKCYGQVPGYLKIFISSAETQERHADEAKHRTDNASSRCNFVKKHQIDDILEVLKRKWQETLSNYLKLPIVTDSLSKRNRKIALEKKLNDYEKNIIVLSNNSHIYVYD